MKPTRTAKLCAYCGAPNAATVDHVIPRLLYPRSRPPGRVRRITVPACEGCNNGLGDDEVQFRNVVALAGEATPTVHLLWSEKIRPSFDKTDKARRIRDLTAQMIRVDTPDGPRHAIFPADNPAVLRVARKIVRGLCHYHSLLATVADDHTWAHIQALEIPEKFLENLVVVGTEPHVFQYAYSSVDHPQIHSIWQMLFYERTPFQGVVFRSAEARSRFENMPITPGRAKALDMDAL